MFKNEIKERLRCASSNKKRHFLEDPITMPCGHSLCKRCLPTDNNSKCQICGIASHIDFVDYKASDGIKFAIQICLDNLFEIIKDETSEQVLKIKNYLNTWRDDVDLKFQFIKEEIEIRIESLKTELENVQKNLQNQLENVKREAIRIEEMKISKANISIAAHEDSLNELKEFLEGKKMKSQSEFYKFNNNLKQLNDIVETTERNFYQLEFSSSKENFKQESVGEIIFNDRRFDCINEETMESIAIETECTDMCVLPNNQILSSNYNDKSLSLYDENFKQIKKINKINDQIFVSFNAACSDTAIYLSDSLNNQIVMLNFKLDFVKKVGSKGSEKHQFDQPWGITFRNDYLYVCDVKNKRVQILTNDLKFYKIFKLDFEAWFIKVTNHTICLQLREPKCIHFYHLNTFKLLNKYDHGWRRISEINSRFYEFDTATLNLHCYDENGDLIRSLETGLNSAHKSYCSGYIFELKGDIYMILDKQKRLLKFHVK